MIAFRIFKASRSQKINLWHSHTHTRTHTRSHNILRTVSVRTHATGSGHSVLHHGVQAIVRFVLIGDGVQPGPFLPAVIHRRQVVLVVLGGHRRHHGNARGGTEVRRGRRSQARRCC